MSRHFAALAYTPSVQASQRRYGGRELPVPAEHPDIELGPRECEFIAARDSFYLSTVSETGWPHVQHRGGPPGFLKVLDPATLAFADLSGNRQYVSVGNLAHNARAALILMDYPNRRRLKILGHVEVIDLAAGREDLLRTAANSELLAKMPALGDDVERILTIRVAAFDWNCSRHITPRFTESEWQTRCSSTTEPSITKE
ncbi:MAG: pyridoxamine 5'-phosphate oxidase family protein [Dechloromonas sp.]|nr:pyridoxamine 5'-phosphate oxidase family protein [Dechloromonas sp.]